MNRPCITEEGSRPALSLFHKEGLLKELRLDVSRTGRGRGRGRGHLCGRGAHTPRSPGSGSHALPLSGLSAKASPITPARQRLPAKARTPSGSPRSPGIAAQRPDGRGRQAPTHVPSRSVLGTRLPSRSPTAAPVARVRSRSRSPSAAVRAVTARTGHVPTRSPPSEPVARATHGPPPLGPVPKRRGLAVPAKASMVGPPPATWTGSQARPRAANKRAEAPELELEQQQDGFFRFVGGADSHGFEDEDNLEQQGADGHSCEEGGEEEDNIERGSDGHGSFEEEEEEDNLDDDGLEEDLEKECDNWLTCEYHDDNDVD
jgi:hypothetical protein